MESTQNGFKNANGINLYYEIYGEGQPLVLIHGGGSSGFFDFEETIKRLTGSFQCITIDLQNHGRSDHRTIPETFEQDAKDVIAVLEQLGIDKAFFWGFSNGATTVLEMAHLFPEKVEKIVVASGVTKRSGIMNGFFEHMQRATINDMPQYLKDHFLQVNPDPGKLQNMFEKDSQRMVHFRDWDDGALASITAPALFIVGDRDVMTVKHVANMNELVAGSRMMVIPSGHGAYMMADENGKVDNELVDFTINQVKKFLYN